MKNQFINKLFIICIVLFSIQNINAQNFQFQGNITNDTIWSADTLEITGDVLIDSNVTLTVLPGTFVHILGYYAIWSYGSIRAIGSVTDTIVFTHLNTINHNDTSTIEGGWHGIRLLPRSSSDTTIFKYCKITNGKAVVPGSWVPYNDKPDNIGGNIYGIDFGSMILSNCNISNGRVKADGGGVFLENGDYVCIEQCDFTYNHSYYEIGGGAFISKIENVLIRNCLFYRNTCYNSDEIGEGGQGAGIAIQYGLGYDAYALIENNKLFNNKGGTGTIYESYYNSKVIGNIMCNNYGCGIWNAHFFNHTVYTNNTIVNNVGSIYSGIVTMADDIKLINNIVRGNYAYPNYPIDQIFHGGAPSPEVSYCNVEFGYEGEGNFDSVAFFTNPTMGIGQEYDALNADWSLTDESPCINTGTPDTSGLFLPDYDIEGNPRICGFRIDMGAYENQVFANIKPVLQENIFTTVYPNPGTNKLNIKTKLKNSTFELIDFTGKIIIRKSLNSITKQINTSNIPSGMYFYRIHDNGKIIESGKWVKR